MRFLQRVYDMTAPGATRAFYADWAESYDREIGESGYAAPARCAAALAAAATDLTAPMIDIGCGTGLSGAAFRDAGFTAIDGTDVSEAMLAQARARNVYRALRLDEVMAEPFAPGTYAHAAAVGVLGPGHAPPGLIDAVLRALGPGGCFVFSLNDRTLGDPAFEGRVREWTDCGSVSVLGRETGPHLPGIGMNSVVYVLQKR